MSQRFVMVVAMALAATVAAAIPANAQSAEAETVMRTPDGQPDISGIFTFRTLTRSSAPRRSRARTGSAPRRRPSSRPPNGSG